MADEQPEAGPARGPQAAGSSRRDLLERALAAGAVVWAAGVAIPAAMYLWPAGSSGPTRKFLELDPASLPRGTAVVLGSGGKPVLVVHLPSGEFRALSAVCTHLGCMVSWNEAQGHIDCPCHAAVFAADGSVVSGPPPRPLPSYPTRMIGGVLRIET